jgi:hypothetical protein
MGPIRARSRAVDRAQMERVGGVRTSITTAPAPPLSLALLLQAALPFFADTADAGPASLVRPPRAARPQAASPTKLAASPVASHAIPWRFAVLWRGGSPCLPCAHRPPTLPGRAAALTVLVSSFHSQLSLTPSSHLPLPAGPLLRRRPGGRGAHCLRCGRQRRPRGGGAGGHAGERAAGAQRRRLVFAARCAVGLRLRGSGWGGVGGVAGLAGLRRGLVGQSTRGRAVNAWYACVLAQHHACRRRRTALPRQPRLSLLALLPLLARSQAQAGPRGWSWRRRAPRHSWRRRPGCC